LASHLGEAFAIAREGRPGPVLVDVPKDVQNQKIEYEGRSRGVPVPARRLPAAPADLREAAELIATAQRPLIMAGHGVVLAGAYEELRCLAERTGIPVITTLLGISGFPESHPLHLGMPGMHGEVHVNRAIQQADLIVGVGLRFDDRVTGNTAAFAPRAKIIHLELDPSEVGKNVPATVALLGDCRTVLRELLRAVGPRDCRAWRAEIAGLMKSRTEQYRGDLSPEGILQVLDEE